MTLPPRHNAPNQCPTPLLCTNPNNPKQSPCIQRRLKSGIQPRVAEPGTHTIDHDTIEVVCPCSEGFDALGVHEFGEVVAVLHVCGVLVAQGGEEVVVPLLLELVMGSEDLDRGADDAVGGFYIVFVAGLLEFGQEEEAEEESGEDVDGESLFEFFCEREVFDFDAGVGDDGVETG